MGIEAVDYRSLVDTVTDRLRRAIVNAAIAPGERLPETDLAGRFGVSRSTVRQALARLHAERLVETRPRRGTVVVRLSLESAQEVSEARGLLEGYAARDAAALITARELSEMGALAQEMAAALQGHDVARLVELDVAFHDHVARHCHNARVYDLWRGMDGQIGALLAATLHTRRLTPAHVADRHGAVRAALATGDPDGAEEAVRAHYTGVWPEGIG